MDSDVAIPADEAGSTQQRRRGRRTAVGLAVASAILLAGLVIAAALFVQAANMPASFRPAGRIGSLQAVTVTGGQVYYGHLQAISHDSVVLSDVFETVTSTDPRTGQQTTRLVSRRLSEWHGPLDMTIPNDRILFTETVGPDSSVAKGVESAGATH